APEAALPSKVHIWALDVAAVKGGVQAYSRHLIDAVQAALGPEKLQVISKNDTQVALIDFPRLRVRSSGGWPQKIRNPFFVWQILRATLADRPDLVILSHINLSPIAYWLRRLTGTPYWCVAHGVEAWNLKRRAHVQALRAAQHIFAVSSYTRD